MTTEAPKKIEAKYPGAKCWECPFADRQIVPPDGPEDADVLFLGQAPATTEVKLGIPMTGKSGKAHEAALMEHGMSRAEVRVDNSILCFFAGGERPPREAIEACRGHLKLDKHKVIVPMGNDALGVVTGQWDGILSVSGTATKVGEQTVIPLTHPAFYLRSQPHWFRDFIDGIGLVKDHVDGKDYYHVGREYHVVDNKQDALDILHKLRDDPPEDLIVDLETEYADIAAAKILCVVLAWEEETAVVIPWDRKYLEQHKSDLPPLLEDWDVYNALKECIEAQPNGIGAHNAPFDAGLLQREDIDVKISFDTLLMHYALDERVGAQSLKYIATLLIGSHDWESELKPHLKNKEAPYSDIPPEVLFKYAAADGSITVAVKNKLKRMLDDPENDGPRRLYYEVLSELNQMFTTLAPRGVAMDVKMLAEALETMPRRQEELLEELREMVGDPFYNPRSYLDNRRVMFKKFNLPQIKGESTDKDVLEALSGQHPFIDLLQEYRQYQKIVGTYLVNLALSYRDGFGYPDLKLFGTVTGRLSANKLNPLVFPRESRGERYAVAKKIFVADEGDILIQADYSGMELRILAVLADDPYMLEVLSDRDADWHAEMAKQMYGQEFADADADRRKEMRVIAKMLVFGLNYGRGVPSISRQLGCDRKDQCLKCQTNRTCQRALKMATELVEAYFKPIPRVKAYREEIVRQVKMSGFLETPFGRRRRYPMITSEAWIGMEKQIYNFPMQATGNTCNLMAMNAVWKEMGHIARPLWPVHDSSLFNVSGKASRADVVDLINLLEGTPSRLLETDLPFFMDVEMGTRWGELNNKWKFEDGEWKGELPTPQIAQLKPLKTAD